MHPAQSKQSEKLEAEALELLKTHRRNPNAETRSALQEFRNRSAGHEAAALRAEQFLRLSRQLDRPRRKPSQNLWFKLDLWWARLSEQHLPLAASVTAILVAATTLWILSTGSQNGQPAIAEVEPATPVVAETFRTKWRQQRKVELADGSVVWLGWQSTLDLELSATQRNVTLHRGIAAFEVTPDPDRPFIVEADGVQTRVTGTEFIVNAQRSGRVEVAVLEGRVIVTDPAVSEATLTAAQTVTVDNGVMGNVTRRPLDEIGQWRNGMLVFNDRPLQDALSTLEPYTSYELDMTDIAGHSGLVSGVFFVEQADDALVTILETHRLEIEQTGGNQLRLRRARPQRP